MNDAIDAQILAELQTNGRLAVAQLARNVGLSRSRVLRRIRRLEQSGDILGYQAELDSQAAGGMSVCYAKVRLRENHANAMRLFEGEMGRRAILECYLLAGDFDYLLKIAVPKHAEEALSLKWSLHAMPGVDQVVWLPVAKPRGESMGAQDMKALRLLQTNGRLSVPRLARQLNLTTTMAARCLRRLCERGFITGFAAVIGEVPAAAECIAFAMIRFTAAARMAETSAKPWFQSDPRVLAWHQVGGTFDILIKIRCGAIADYVQMLKESILGLPGIADVKSYLVLRRVKVDCHLPI